MKHKRPGVDTCLHVRHEDVASLNSLLALSHIPTFRLLFTETETQRERERAFTENSYLQSLKVTEIGGITTIHWLHRERESSYRELISPKPRGNRNRWNQNHPLVTPTS